MAYVEPTTNIQFYSGMNLSPSYGDTLYFATESAKNSYFTAITKTAITNNATYQRERRGFIRVQIPIATMYTVDYMRFQNPLFENKWFYAFVLSVNYVNNVTTEVEYQLDPMMTWMGDFSLTECYIERQHASDDTIGANLVDEGLPTGEYVVEEAHETFNPDIEDWYVCVVYKPETYSDVTSLKVNGIYSGCVTTWFNSVSDLQTFLQNLLDNNLIDNVVSMFMCPPEFILSSSAGSRTANLINIYLYPPYSKVGEYTPKNNKLFTYPYKYMMVDNMEGQDIIYRYEFMQTAKLGTTENPEYVNVYNIYNTIGSSCECYLVPSKYKNDIGVGTAYGKDLNGEDLETLSSIEGGINTISKTHFPMCSFSYDSYKAWLAQKNAYYQLDFATEYGDNMIRANVEAIGSATSSMLGKDTLSTGIQSTIDVAETAIETSATLVYNNFVLNHITPKTSNKSVGTPTNDAYSSNDKNTFMMYGMCVTKEYAQMIDDYFTMFGYAQKKVGTPNMHVRKYFTFCKTIGCHVNGNLPADDARFIEALFDSGIRFWVNHDVIGNYNVDNSIVE